MYVISLHALHVHCVQGSVMAKYLIEGCQGGPQLVRHTLGSVLLLPPFGSVLLRPPFARVLLLPPCGSVLLLRLLLQLHLPRKAADQQVVVPTRLQLPLPLLPWPSVGCGCGRVGGCRWWGRCAGVGTRGQRQIDRERGWHGDWYCDYTGE